MKKLIATATFLMLLLVPSVLADSVIDENRKSETVINMTLTSDFYISCSWDDPDSDYRNCSIEIEISNDGATDYITVGDTYILDFTHNANSVKIFNTTMYDDAVREVLNSTCFNELSEEEQTEELATREQCFYNITVKTGSNYTDNTEIPDIKGDSLILVKFEFESQSVVEDGVYQDNPFNFTLLGDSYNASLDPTVSSCTLMSTSNSLYNLTGDVINATTSPCMRFHHTSSNIVFEMNGFTVDGTGGGEAFNNYGTNNTMRNGKFNEWSYGINADDSALTHGNFMENLTISNMTYGWFFKSLDASDRIYLSDIDFRDNTWDIYLADDMRNTYCGYFGGHANFTNVTGDNGYPIEWYGSGDTYVNISGGNFDELMLCAAHNFNISNIIIHDNSLFMVATSSGTFRNVTSNNNDRGIHLEDSSNSNSIFDSVFTGNTYGVYSQFVNGNTINNSNVSYNTYGFRFYRNSDFWKLQNVQINKNTYGVSIDTNAEATITNCTFNNTNRDIWFYGSVGEVGTSDIYNNYFAHSTIYFQSTSRVHRWNTTMQAGSRVISNGTAIGGNYWSNAGGTGFSDTCTDSDTDGFCDSSNDLGDSNYDYLPLSNQYLPDITPPSIILYSPQNTTYNAINVILQVSADETIDTWWYSLNGGSNVTFVPNTTMTASEGSNTLSVWANDTAGNENISSVAFTVNVPPQFAFVSPTPPNGTASESTSVFINVSITESSLNALIFNWDGTNYTFFNESLVVFYNFDNVSSVGDTASSVADLSGFGNDGTFVADVKWSDDSVFGKSVYFDGIDDKINIPMTDSLNMTYTGASVCSWVNLSIDAYAGSTIAKWFGTDYFDCRFSIWRFYMALWDADNSKNPNIATTEIYNGTGYHYFCCVWDLPAKKIRLYVNAELKKEGTDTTVDVNPTGSWDIGKNGSTSSLKGNIDELMIFNRALVGDEISHLFSLNLRKYDADSWVFSVNQTNLTDGSYQYYVYADDDDAESNVSDTQTLTIDLISPSITIYSPANVSYDSTNVSLQVSADESIDTWFYSLNGGANTTFTPNATVNATEGSNTIVVYANDSAGNLGSAMVTFTVETVTPLIFFTDPTLANGSVTFNNYVDVNISVTEQNFNEFIFNWDGSNYTIYDNDVVLKMNFDNVSALGESNSASEDISVYDNDGVISSANYISGKYNYGLDFRRDAVNYVNVSSPSFNFSGTLPYTATAWIYPIEGAYGSFILTQYDQGVKGLWYMKIDTAGNVSCLRESPPDYKTITTETVNLNEWSHITCNYNGTHMQIYINGELVKVQSSGSIPYIDMDFYVGARLSGGQIQNSTAFNGTIDEVVLWNRSLTDSELEQVYSSSLNKYDTDKWMFSSNQTITAGGFYAFYGHISDTAGNSNSTNTRILNVSIDTSSPEISVEYPSSVNPLESSSVTLYINFTAVDASTLDNSTAVLKVEKGAVTKTNSSCNPVDQGSGTTVKYECSISMDYYDEAGVWSINATVCDTGGYCGSNTTENITYNQLKAFTVNVSSLDFGSVTLISQPSYDDVRLENTGNQQSTATITAYDLIGQTDPADKLEADIFSVENSTTYVYMLNATGVQDSDWLLDVYPSPYLDMHFRLEPSLISRSIMAQLFNNTVGEEWVISI